MNKTSKKFAIAFGLIAVLLLVTTVGGIRAELQRSDEYRSQFEMQHIGITLLENGNDVGHRDYYTVGDEGEKKGQSTEFGWKVAAKPLFESIANFKVGETYPEEFAVNNSGEIDEYVRVIVYKYWVKEDGNKEFDSSFNPDLIELNLIKNGNWILDSSASTRERAILYYRYPIKPGDSTAIFADTLRISPDVVKDIKETTTGEIKGEGDKTYRTTTYTYQYNGYKFCVEMEADAVQTHSAKDVIKSTWGREVSIDSNSGELSLS